MKTAVFLEKLNSSWKAGNELIKKTKLQSLAIYKSQTEGSFLNKEFIACNCISGRQATSKPNMGDFWAQLQQLQILKPIVSQLSKCLKFMTFREGCFLIRN